MLRKIKRMKIIILSVAKVIQIYIMKDWNFQLKEQQLSL